MPFLGPDLVNWTTGRCAAGRTWCRPRVDGGHAHRRLQVSGPGRLLIGFVWFQKVAMHKSYFSKLGALNCRRRFCGLGVDATEPSGLHRLRGNLAESAEPAAQHLRGPGTCGGTTSHLHQRRPKPEGNEINFGKL